MFYVYFSFYVFTSLVSFSKKTDKDKIFYL